MTGLELIPAVTLLGIRHGVDPDHLAAIDGLSRFHPSRWNGFLFAFGHGAVVTLLAVGFGGLLAKMIAPYTVYLLILVGVANLWRLIRGATHRHAPPRNIPSALRGSPLMLGVIFGMGFETATQLSALLLAGSLNPWLLGVAFSSGMMLIDGTDGVFAARTQRNALGGNPRATHASKVLGLLVVLFSFGLVGAELAGRNMDRIALPLGSSLFAALLGLRIWSGLAGSVASRRPVR